MTAPIDKQPSIDKEFREQLAAIEHERWADWQKWVHAQMTDEYTAGGKLAFTIPIETVVRWQTQITTPYKKLSEKEKDSDREQVDRYLPLLTKLIESAVIEGKKDELNKARDNFYSTDRGFSYFDDRIAELQAQAKEK
jgi:hypothetical protein